MFLLSSHITPEHLEKIRLYDYAPAIFEKYIPSRKGIKKALKKERLLVDGVVGTSGQWLKPHQKIELFDLEEKPPMDYELPLEVIFEDEHMAVINKPAGITVSGNAFRTVQNCLQANLKPSTKDDALKWPRPAHRLDNPTSGLLLIAKTASALMHIGHQFENKTIKKEYTAIVVGEVKGEGTINLDIDQQEAISHYKVLKSIESLQNGHLTQIMLHPLMGRTHQLRIHCASSGFPILGDKAYGKAGQILKHKGLFLCATAIALKHPEDEKLIQFKLELPTKFKGLWEREKKRWAKFN